MRSEREAEREIPGTASLLTGSQYRIVISYLEVYNETIRDLLVPEEQQRPLELWEDRERGCVVMKLTEHDITAAEGVLELLEQGNKARFLLLVLHLSSSLSVWPLSLSLSLPLFLLSLSRALSVGFSLLRRSDYCSSPLSSSPPHTVLCSVVGKAQRTRMLSPLDRTPSCRSDAR